MNKILIGLALAIAALMLGAVSAMACAMPTPGGGPAFGQHVSAMAPAQSGMMTGADYGDCVAMMARQGTCDCSCLTA